MLVGPDSNPDISVVIVLWNCGDFIDSCLAALARTTTTVEVLCIDNASEDDSAARAEGWGCPVERLPRNIGFPSAVNVLLPRCRADVTLLLNPDVVIGTDALNRCLQTLEEPGVGLVGANLTRPDGRPDPAAARRFRSLMTITVESIGLPVVWRRLDLQYFPTWDRSENRDVPCINGAFAMARTDTLREIGGLDETVFLYLEDQELCRSITARGERVVFVADAAATHAGGGPTQAASSQQRAAAYLHRLDASLEIVRRRQGRLPRLLAIGVLLVRCVALLALSLLARDRDGRRKYVEAIRWLVAQPTRRSPPPPVP